MANEFEEASPFITRPVIASICAVLTVVILSVAVSSPIENPYEATISSVADERGWKRDDIQALSGKTRGIAGFQWTTVKLLVHVADNETPVYVTASKTPFLSASVSCFSVDESCGT